MKFLATLLCFVLATLWVQPLLPHAVAHEEKIESCCSKKKAEASKGCHSEGDERGCCEGGKCNPFFTGCAGCAALALVPAPRFQPRNIPVEFYAVEHAPLQAGALVSYSAAVLQPPEVVS